MNRKKLDKLREELNRMRRASVKATDIQSLATKLGRRSVDRGREPMWESTKFPHLFVLAIPAHGGKDLSTGVKHSVLNQLEEDILAWDEWLSGSDRGDGNGF
jgi:hypothetical protein